MPPARSPWPLRARALLLDLDGTLVDSTASVEAAWHAAAERLRVPFDAFVPYLHGIPAEQALELACPGLPQPTRAAIAEELLRVQALPEAPVELTPGAAAFLAALPAHGWAIVTSGDRRLAHSRMRKTGIPDPPVLVTADDISRGKPDPEPYARAASALGVAAADCLVVEDAPAGVAAARAAKMRVLALVTTHSPAELAGATAEVPDLSHVAVRSGPDGFRLQRRS